MVRYAMEQDERADDEFPRSSWTVAGLLLSLAGALASTMVCSAVVLSFGAYGKTICSILLGIVCLIYRRKVGRVAWVVSTLAVASFYRRRKNGEVRRYSDTDVDMSEFERELRQMIWNAKRYNMLPKVDGWLQKYKGKEGELRNKLAQKLNVESKSDNASQLSASTSASQCMQRHNNESPAMKQFFDSRDIQEQHHQQTIHRRLHMRDPTPRQKRPTVNLNDAKLEAQLEIDSHPETQPGELSS